MGGVPAVGEQLVESGLGPAALDPGDHVGEVGERVDARALAGVDDGASGGDVGGAVLAAGEEVVFLPELAGTDLSLGLAVVDLETPVVEA